MEEAAGTDVTTRAPRRGETLELEIDSLAFGGRGVARAGGFVVFVAGGLPGDRVRAEVTKGKKRFAEARTLEVLRPGTERLPDTCVHEGEPCPGAPWQGLPYERQLAHKQEQVAEALRRIGSLEGFELEEIVPAVEQWRYRNKLEYSFGEREDEPTLGFHARGRWDLIVDVDDCHLASAAGNEARNAVRDWARAEAVAAYDARARRGVLRNLAVREGRRTGQIQTRLVTTKARFPRPPVDLHTIVEGDSGGTDGPTGVLGEERLREELCGLKLEMSHGAFFQTNTEMAERLYGVAAEFAGLAGRERVFDLFCGIGTIGLTMAAAAGEIWGLEIVPEAIEDAERNAKANGIENAHFMAANARTGVRPLVEKAGKPDVVVVDPPRAGLSQKIVRRVIECEADRIVYVSCNPTTLAPNAAQLVEAGYRLTRVRPVDMFPQTPHIECVALFQREAKRVAAPANAVQAASDAAEEATSDE
ncbi:MAG TPA: 23S rRNA (uracil(1939)-C(5))-methyltransferase RlmD [Solirubrobacterales bacterium]|nr:23S rRNA (uracil(1939)-C(5))-methyltransferase RlmD [Solirubrobacterales bacterium]